MWDWVHGIGYGQTPTQPKQLLQEEDLERPDIDLKIFVVAGGDQITKSEDEAGTRRVTIGGSHLTKGNGAKFTCSSQGAGGQMKVSHGNKGERAQMEQVPGEERPSRQQHRTRWDVRGS